MNCRHRCAAPRPGSPLPAARCAAPRSRRAFPLPRRCLDVQFALWQAANVPMCLVPFAVGGGEGAGGSGLDPDSKSLLVLFSSPNHSQAPQVKALSPKRIQSSNHNRHISLLAIRNPVDWIWILPMGTFFLYLAFSLKLMRSPSLQSSMYGCPLAIRHSCVPNVSPFVSVGCTDSLRAFVSSPPHLPPLALPGVLPRAPRRAPSAWAMPSPHLPRELAISVN